DLGSAKGTRLNGKKITSPQLLFDGDVISLADERLYYKKG
ncbi:MAG: FHA domain-containing protein, partial [Clostridia bacterium]|nr:FHA domain-containing protein [Clostridia bacterium]